MGTRLVFGIGMDGVAIFLLVLWSIMIFLIIGLVLAIFMCRLGGDKNESSPPKPATLGRYIRHEHLLLSIIWSGRIIKYYDRHYMNRSRRLVLCGCVSAQLYRGGHC